MRKVSVFLFLLMVPIAAHAQQQASFVTMTGANTNYPGGTMTANFLPPADSSQFDYLKYHFPFTATAPLNGSGAWTMQLADTGSVMPANSQWRLQMCSAAPQGSAPICYQVIMPITCINNASCSGTTLDLSSSFSAAPAAQQTTMQQLLVSKTYVVTPQTVRGVVGAYAGLSTSNSSTFLDIFPFGYNPWLSGITFEDYATNATGISGAITLGLADDNNNSQRICFVGARTPTFDSIFCLFAHSGQLTWNATGDAVVVGSGVTTSVNTEYGFAARVGLDGPNGNAVLAGGGSAKAAVGAALAGNNATFAGTYFFLCAINGTCGAGIQKTDPTLDNWFVTLAGAETVASTKIGTGTVLSRYSRYNGVFTPVAVAANTCAAQSFTVTGVVAGDILIGVNKPTEQAGLSVTPGHVTGTNTATMNFCNSTAISITPTAAETYNMVVVQ